MKIEEHSRLVNVMVEQKKAEEYQVQSKEWQSFDLTKRQINDLELIMNGAFTPLTGFMIQKDFDSVCESMRLSDGSLFPIPVTLDVNETLAQKIKPGSKVALRDPEGVILAALNVEDVWEQDVVKEAEAVYGTADKSHPGVQYLINGAKNFRIGGSIEGIQLPIHYNFRQNYMTPAELHDQFDRLGWRRVTAYHSESPMHKLEVELTLGAVRKVMSNLLIHPIFPTINSSKYDKYTRSRCYSEVIRYYPQGTAMLAFIPLAERLAGPREALWHALIRQNYGCSHIIITNDHGSPYNERNGIKFYGSTEAQELVEKHQSELKIEMVKAENLVYLQDKDSFVPEEDIRQNNRPLRLTEKELTERLEEGRGIPSWFTFPEIAQKLRDARPPRHQQGLTVFFTGLSGSGKSTAAKILMAKLLEIGGRPVTLLDGDIVRKYLSSELGFSREHRDINIRRIGFVASEITKNGGIAVCAPIAPYSRVRDQVREMIEPFGGFVLIHVATPLDVCASRDHKGMYAKAMAGVIKNFTGVSDPYEAPEDADVVIDMSNIQKEMAVQEIILYLEKKGFIGLAI